ncbi:uncharacterized protein N7443_010106 [Penicillium atrosanguineum]|uniref:uncharacterized protein n=1 Tax=Penicillium atrosanguineum TaxID=1132637 RepID=UPI00239A9EC8|nr:uncharacterized protein N7443_010106 [Penicillium atrosanguineum]KAJ5289853.1 hypothetical protein N7443_010106 [Penicillium atrosanguineum]
MEVDYDVVVVAKPSQLFDFLSRNLHCGKSTTTKSQQLQALSLPMNSPSPQLLRALRTSLTNAPRSFRLGVNASRLPRSFNASPCAPLPSTRRNNGTSIRPSRMIPRSHSHKPVSHDRGPESDESTQTDFAALDVLGNMPAPSTAVDATLDSGFHLNSGVKISGGDAVILVGGEAFAWRPWKTVQGAANDREAKASMINAKGQFEIDEAAWGLLSAVYPRPDMLILGLGASMYPLSPETKRHINSLGIRVEVQDTRNAAAQFNMLATERGVNDIAAALIPIGWKGRL